MMQKKQYEAIARIIAAEQPATERERLEPGRGNACHGIATGLADVLEQVSGDPTFDRARFLKACGVEE